MIDRDASTTFNIYAHSFAKAQAKTSEAVARTYNFDTMPPFEGFCTPLMEKCTLQQSFFDPALVNKNWTQKLKNWTPVFNFGQHRLYD